MRLLLLVLPCALYAQPWAGIIDSPRAIDWSAAGAGMIPARSTICQTLTSSATVSNINTAIANCTAGQTVYLSAGTYSLAGQITLKSNVTLRGAGPTQTKLVFSSIGDCNGLGAAICAINAANNYSGSPGNVATWTAGYTRGTTSITLGSVTTGSINNLVVGSQLMLDQLDDASDPGADIYVCGGTAPCSLQGGVGNGRSGRAQIQTVTVTSKSGSGPWTIGITPGLYAPNWRSGQSPGAWYSSAVPITGVGIEGLTFDVTGVSNYNGSGIMFTNASYSWVRNVRGINDGSVHKHVWIYQGSHITVRDSYFYGSNGTSESYGVDSGYGGSDNLIENNICQKVATCTIAEGSAGTVFAYNYATDNYYIAYDVWQQQDGYHHSVGDHYLLWEGNIGSGFTADIIHGGSFMLTTFRNRYSGRDVAGAQTKTKQTNSIHLYPKNRFLNMVGNVLGTASYHTNYQSAATTTTEAGNATAANLSVYVLNFSGNEGTYDSSIPNDLNVSATLMRWGNYDTVGNAVKWDNAEVPSGVSTYSNAVPASQTLPASFYLPLKPAWFGSVAWPAIGPDVTGGNIANVGGFANKIPAQVCYEATGATNGIKDFDATLCYQSAASGASTAGIAGKVGLSGKVTIK